MTLVEDLADFVVSTDAAALPAAVVEESKRILLDSVGCALAALDTEMGRIAIKYARITGGFADVATIIGQSERSSVHGASFANADLINALDYDAIAPPGHVAPYVVPGALAVGESVQATGASLVSAIAVGHEISFRLAKAMDNNRDVRDGRWVEAPVLGYSCALFGATTANGVMKSMTREAVANAIGITASISQVNAHRSYLNHAPSQTIKYVSPGHFAETGLTAAYMADLGHRGDLQILDDVEFGYPRFIGTTRWDPSALTIDLGRDWRYLAESVFKPYPHCRVSHALFDALYDVVSANHIRPDEIQELNAFGEGWAQLPTFTNLLIERPHDAQMSYSHGLAVAAHLVRPGKRWQDPEIVFSPSVLELMRKVVFHPHPDWATEVAKHPGARPSRVEIVARGRSYVAERNFPKGSPSSDPSTTMTTDELVTKFRHNAEGVITPDAAEQAIDLVLRLEELEDINALMNLARPASD